jgi:hypothetical protein
MMLDLTVLDTAELSSLSKAMHEARFPEVWDDPIVWLSPFVIELHVAATEESRRRLIETGAQARLHNFDQWLRQNSRPEFNIFKSRMNDDPWLQEKVRTEGPQFVRWALRPYILEESVITEMVEYANRLPGTPGSK